MSTSDTVESDKAALVDEFFSKTDASSLAPIEDTLRKFEEFVLVYSSNLNSKLLSDKTPYHTYTNIGFNWDVFSSSIGLALQPTSPLADDNNAELIALLNDVHEKSPELKKILLCFLSLSNEVDDMYEIATKTYFPFLTMFRIDPDNSNLNSDEAIASSLSLLSKLGSLIKHIKKVIQNIITQYTVLYHDKQSLYMSVYNTVHFDVGFKALGKALRTGLILDSLISNNTSISSSWINFKRMCKYVHTDPTLFSISPEKLIQFESLLVALDEAIMTGGIYQNLINQVFENDLIIGNHTLYDEFNYVLKNWLKELDQIGETAEPFERIQIVDLYALYGLFRTLFVHSSKADKSLYKKMWEIQTKVPIIELYGRSCFFIAEFLNQFLPDKSVSLSPHDYIKTRKQILGTIDDNWIKKTQHYYLQVVTWMVRVESDLFDKNSKNLNSLSAVLNARGKLLITGLLLANNIRTDFVNLIMLHIHLHKPFHQYNARAMGIYAEMLHAIRHTYIRISCVISTTIGHMIGQIKFTIRRILSPLKVLVDSKINASSNTEYYSHLSAAVDLLLKLFSTPQTRLGINVTKSALSYIFGSRLLKQKDLDEISYQFWKLELLSSFQERIYRATSTDFMYWILDLIKIVFKDIFNNPDQGHRLPYLLSGLEDCLPMISHIKSLKNEQQYAQEFKDGIKKLLDEEILTPLCCAIEDDLRLHIHSIVLDQDLQNPTQTKHLTRFIEIPPLHLFGEVMIIKDIVANYLDLSFYNHMTDALHDWRIYAEMKNLAHEKYGLVLNEVHLPGHSHYSQGLDVLEIMRNIHVFVAKFNYNLNSQTFIERAFEQKHLNTIDIHHIASSISTHGLGITNTTINFTYQFLSHKFLIFSEFLYDDHIKSRLMKDVTWFREQTQLSLEKSKSSHPTMIAVYPFDRAEKFNRDIRKLGLLNDRTYLDMFRILVTEIGNALGYVRMVRSGALQYAASSIKFVPDLDEIPEFEELARSNAAALSDDTITASKNLKTVLDDLSRSFAEGTDYFSVLVSVFSCVISASDQQHLRFLYIIIPPLTVNFVENMLEEKDQLAKKPSKNEASFTDDGFALGLAYFLKLLKQDANFDSLHWFESVTAKFQDEENIIKEKLKKAKKDQAQMLELSLKKVHASKLEYEMLFYSFNGSRIFFREIVGTDQIEGQKPGSNNQSSVPIPPVI